MEACFTHTMMLGSKVFAPYDTIGVIPIAAIKALIIFFLAHWAVILLYYAASSMNGRCRILRERKVRASQGRMPDNVRWE